MEVNILLVEDDVNLGFVMSDLLKSKGYHVCLAMDGMEGYKKFNEKNFHLCILDVMMPKKDGFSLAKDIRKINEKVPILFVSAKSDTEDKVEGFHSGCDDYITKPFSLEEFTLRVKSLLKRNTNEASAEFQTEYQFGKFIFDRKNYVLKGTFFEKKLTKKEAEVLGLLLRHPEQVLSREAILTAVWGKDDYFTGRSLDVFITKLRKYLSEDPELNIVNVHGIGFKLDYPKN
jgi:DNA-binding response OmpR family regulator